MHINKYYYLGKNILFPICRSITGRGIQKSLKIIQNEFPLLKIHHVNSGKKVFDWKVPPEWNVKNAYIKNDTIVKSHADEDKIPF
jgi:aminopeptidase-like protein